MITVSVTYPQQSGTFFDLDYYMHKHMPMAKTLLMTAGLQDIRLLRGTEVPTGGAPIYAMMALLTFEDADACRAALAQHGKQILEDIPNFTDMKAALQMNEPIEY